MAGKTTVFLYQNMLNLEQLDFGIYGSDSLSSITLKFELTPLTSDGLILHQEQASDSFFSSEKYFLSIGRMYPYRNLTR